MGTSESNAAYNAAGIWLHSHQSHHKTRSQDKENKGVSTKTIDKNRIEKRKLNKRFVFQQEQG